MKKERETPAKNGEVSSQNGRISTEEALEFFKKDLSEIGQIANEIKTSRFGNQIFFNKNFHIEPTNVCIFDCKFCSYSRAYKNREAGWELSEDEILETVEKYVGKSVTEVHIVGGVHPKMDLLYFGEVIKKIKKILPKIHVKAFTAVELHYMFKRAKKSSKEGLEYLVSCGLDSLPGGGAEIFNEAIRSKICHDKCTSQEWLDIHKTAHKAGIPTTATMLYGHYESYEHRIEHMDRLRTLQDQTGGFNAFIPLKFRNQNNQMEHLDETSIIDDFKTYAISRIFFDNIHHIKVYWPMIGREVAQSLLSFGVDDIDGTIDDSTKIYSMAGAEEQNPKMTTDEIVELISATGNVAVERNSTYEKVKKHLPQNMLN